MIDGSRKYTLVTNLRKHWPKQMRGSIKKLTTPAAKKYKFNEQDIFESGSTRHPHKRHIPSLQEPPVLQKNAGGLVRFLITGISTVSKGDATWHMVPVRLYSALGLSSQ